MSDSRSYSTHNWHSNISLFCVISCSFLSLIFQASYLFTKKFSIGLGKQIFEQQLWFYGLINNLFKFLSVCVTAFVLWRLKSSTIICDPGILHTTINKYSHSSLPAQYLFASHLHSILLFQLPIFISETLTQLDYLLHQSLLEILSQTQNHCFAYR